MTVTVCLVANTLYYPKGGGHRWAYLNWALGIQGLGCRVIWLEGLEPDTSAQEARRYVAVLKEHLRPYGLADRFALCPWEDEPMPSGVGDDCLTLDDAVQADLLLNFRYGLRPGIVNRFRRSALVDIDPGLLQIWLAARSFRVSPHDVYFTTSEIVGTPEARLPDAGIEWHHAPPCVALDWWPPRRAAENAPWTTVSHWGAANEWVKAGDTVYCNDKQVGFAPFLDLPQHTTQPLELALCLAEAQRDQWLDLEHRGWRVRHSFTVAATPWDYQRYIQNSLGEFSCAKPSCMRLQNAWISDRTLVYLASGKPAVVQHTGASQLLPEHAGVFRFRDMKEAVWALETVASDYDRQCELARSLVEEQFDAKQIIASVLERALD